MNFIVCTFFFGKSIPVTTQREISQNENLNCTLSGLPNSEVNFYQGKIFLTVKVIDQKLFNL